VHVSRIGFTPLKGTRHAEQPFVDLTHDGPMGDRVFCLVDRSRGRVLRTVENPLLLRTTARWHSGVLTTALPGRTVEDVPAPTGEQIKVDYWSRLAALDVVQGPWAAAYSEHLGYDVELARSTRPGEVVYGGAVSLVTSASLERLEAEVGAPVESAQFRATVTVATRGEPAHVEDSWIGQLLRLGDAEVEVRGALPRCAVVDLDPATGERRAAVLRALAGYRRDRGEIVFGVDAVVTQPGRVDVNAVVKRG
jgi:uncharacterized protein YcbX